MNLVEIDDIVPLPESGEHLAGASVELPSAGSGREQWAFPIAGWVLGRHEPVTSVEVVHQHVRLRSAAVDHERLDVAWSYPDIPHAAGSGFSLRCGTLALPHTFVLRLEAGFANGHRIPFALLRGRRRPVPPAPSSAAASGSATTPALSGIAVTALDRSGSTVAMALLAGHPEVVVGGGFPYGSRPASYWWHMLRVLGEPADPIGSAHPDTYQQNLHWLGHHPLAGAPLTDTPEVEAWFGRDYVEQLAAFGVASAGQLYARIAAAQGVSAPRYYAEKHEPGPVPRLLAEVDEGSRELLVVRDARDMACSMLAFARKRAGLTEADPAADETATAEFIVSLAPAVARLVAYARERGDAAHVVRYEDLITAPGETLTGILSHLGLEAKPKVVAAAVRAAAAATPELSAHRTTADGAASIGRHAGELTPGLLEAADDAFGPALDMFGYERRAWAPASR